MVPMRQLAVLSLPALGLLVVMLVVVSLILGNDDLSEVGRVGLFAASLGMFGTLLAAYGGWAYAIHRDTAQRKHEWKLAHGQRLYERRAGAYEEIVTHLTRTEYLIAQTLPFMGHSTQSPDPIGAMSPGDYNAYVQQAQENGARLIAKIVAYGSPRLKELMTGLSPIQAEFWANVATYRTANQMGQPTTDYYVAAHKLRELFQKARDDLHVQIEAELLSPSL